jgi:glycosyltransferase involved in cell wall biosynthesis
MLADFPLPGQPPCGGVEVVVKTLVGGLARRDDVDLHLLVSRADVRHPCVMPVSKNATVHFLPRFGRLELPTFFLHDRILFHAVLRSLRPDVVHAQNLGRYAYVCGALGFRYALTVHGVTSLEERVVGCSSPRMRLRQVLLRHVEANSLRRADAIVANSSYVGRMVEGKQRQRVECIPNPVEPLFFAPDATTPNEGRVVWVGRFSRLKGVDVLLRAWPRVRREVPRAHLRLIGAPGEALGTAEMQSLVRQPEVEVMGPMHGEALRAEYASAVALVLPSRQENAPLVVGEAMAVGRPVVASRVGGIPDMVQDGETGWLCEPANEDSLAECLIRLLRDSDQQRRMGRAARVKAEVSVRLEPIVERHVHLYHQLASRRDKRHFGWSW